MFTPRKWSQNFKPRLSSFKLKWITSFLHFFAQEVRTGVEGMVHTSPPKKGKNRRFKHTTTNKCIVNLTNKLKMKLRTMRWHFC
jgi:hypothetical protein